MIPTPVVGHGLVFCSSGRAGPTLAIRPGGSARTAAERALKPGGLLQIGDGVVGAGAARNLFHLDLGLAQQQLGESEDVRQRAPDRVDDVPHRPRVALPHFLVGYHTPAVDSPDAFPLMVLDTVLGGAAAPLISLALGNWMAWPVWSP